MKGNWFTLLIGLALIAVCYFGFFNIHSSKKFFEILFSLGVGITLAAIASWMTFIYRFRLIVLIPVAVVGFILTFVGLNHYDFLNSFVHDIPPVRETVEDDPIDPDTSIVYKDTSNVKSEEIDQNNNNSKPEIINVYNFFGVKEFEALLLNGELQPMLGGGDYYLNLEKGDKITLVINKDQRKTKIWEQE